MIQDRVLPDEDTGTFSLVNSVPLGPRDGVLFDGSVRGIPGPVGRGGIPYPENPGSVPSTVSILLWSTENRLMEPPLFRIDANTESHVVYVVTCNA